MKAPSEEPVGVPVAASTTSATDPQDLTPPAAQPAEIESASEPTPVAGITPAQYSDLFDRMRAGFLLEDEDRHAVDVNADWYANHPDYLERAFGRAELYMYHIVTELEARGMPLGARSVAGGRKRLRAVRVFARARRGPLAVHSRHRHALRPEAELVVRRAS